jgi:hypothetical protein
MRNQSLVDFMDESFKRRTIYGRWGQEFVIEIQALYRIPCTYHMVYHWVQNLLFSRLLSKNIKIRIYRTIILPLVLYWCETLSVTLREEHRLRVFENKVLRRLRVLGPKRDEVTGGWRKLHNEELRNLYFSPNIIRTIKSRRMRWTGYIARMGEKRNAYRI